MFSESKDILFLVLALCAAVFTFFVVWLLWYLISMLRSANRVVQGLDAKLRLIEDILHSLKENVGNGSAALVLLTKAVAKFVQFGIEKREERKAKTTKASSRGGFASGGKKGASGKAGSRATTDDDEADFFGDINAS